MKKRRYAVAILAILFCFATIASGCSLTGGKTYRDTAVKTIEGSPIGDVSVESYKDEGFNNPISSQYFCADPTSVEYNGRLYVYATNDHEQFEEAGSERDNTYEYIKSFVVFSTDDMVNWIYHGEINVGEIAPWITNSWAPSIVSRVEDDGLTHFYLYFSNNGLGVGVLTSTDPLGPWNDPLGEPFITADTEGLTGCPNPFDPGVIIDDNGDGWLAFGGGKSPEKSDAMPGSSKIVKLGEDMLSFGSIFYDIPAPYFFEASELNYINGQFVYTYCTDWSDHSVEWDYDAEPATMCSMVYMTTKMVRTGNWEMGGEYFTNPGRTNNHTHLHKFKDNYYIFYQTMMLKDGMGIKGAYRSLGVDMVNVDEENLTIECLKYTEEGVSSICNVDPYAENLAAELNNTANITYNNENVVEPIIISGGEGSWFSVRSVDFAESKTLAFLGNVKGSGRIEVRLDSLNGETVTSIDFDTPNEFKTVYSEAVTQLNGVHDLYFVFSAENIQFNTWQFTDRA